jgi:hypothetical protein
MPKRSPDRALRIRVPVDCFWRDADIQGSRSNSQANQDYQTHGTTRAAVQV